MTQFSSLPKKTLNIIKSVNDIAGDNNIFINEKIIADKYNITISEVISLVKIGNLSELLVEPINSKKRLRLVLKKLYDNINIYKEVKTDKSDFTDAIIVNNDKILLLLRNSDTNIEPNKYGLPGGHLEKFLNPDQNLIKEVKEETNIDIYSSFLCYTKEIKDGKKIYYYWVKPLTIEITLNQGEHKNYIWASFQDIKNGKYDLMFDLQDTLIKILHL